MKNGRSKYAPQPGAIPGTEVTLSGVTLTLAPVNVNQVMALEETIASFATTPSTDLPALLRLAIPVIYAAAARNQPDITEDEVRELVDLGNFQAALNAALQVSGYAAGEDAARRSIGLPSSPTSSALPAGPGSIAASS